MSVSVLVEREVAARAADVFAVLADPFSFERWVCGTRTIRCADPQWPTAGARLWHRFGGWRFGVNGTTAVIEWAPPYRLVLRADVSPLAVVRAIVTVGDVAAGGVRVRIREDVIGGWTVHFGHATAGVQRWRNRRSLRLLAELAEVAGLAGRPAVPEPARDEGQLGPGVGQ